VCEKGLAGAPEGRLRIGRSQGCPQYFLCTRTTTTNGKYLPKSNLELAKRLAQKGYDENILKYSKTSYFHLSRLLKEYQDDKLELIFYSENTEKQKLIVPVEETYEQKLERWISQLYSGKGFGVDDPIITTDNGLRVRSKSERFMANYFDSLGLRYKYECPLILKPYGTIYPDFTFLSRRTGEEIYWEHEGMMDNPEYAKNAIKKIELYEKNGIFPGEKLILTFESSTQILDKKILEIFVQKYML